MFFQTHLALALISILIEIPVLATALRVPNDVIQHRTDVLFVCLFSTWVPAILVVAALGVPDSPILAGILAIATGGLVFASEAIALRAGLRGELFRDQRAPIEISRGRAWFAVLTSKTAGITLTTALVYGIQHIEETTRGAEREARSVSLPSRTDHDTKTLGERQE